MKLSLVNLLSLSASMIFLGVSAHAVAQTPNWVNSGVVGLYLLQEGSGTTIYDSSGNANHATFGTGPTAPYWRSDKGLVFTGSQTNFITMPVALTPNTRTVEVAAVIFPFYAQTTAEIPFGSSGQPVANLELDPIWNINASTNSSYYPQFIGAHPFSFANNPPFLGTTTTVGPTFAVLTRVNDGSAIHIYVNGVEAINYEGTIPAQNLALPNGGNYQLGGSDFGTGSPNSSTGFNGIIYGAKFATTAYTAAQVAQDYSAWLTAAQAKGVNTSAAYGLGPQASFKVLCNGESNTYGHGLSSPSTQNYCAQAQSLITGNPTIVDLGADSDNSGIIDNLLPQVVMPQYNPNGTNVYVLFSNVNDCKLDPTPYSLPLNGSTAATVSARAHDIASRLKTQGWVPVLATGISQVNTSGAKNTCNPAIRTTAQQYGYALWDAASDPNLGADNSFGNSTYFQGDQMHLNVTGQQRMAAALARVVNIALYGGTPVTVTTSTATVTMPTVNANPSANNIALTLDSCIGPTGTRRAIKNVQTAGSHTVTLSPAPGESIDGSTSPRTIANGATLTLLDTFEADSTGGCHWAIQ